MIKTSLLHVTLLTVCPRAPQVLAVTSRTTWSCTSSSSALSPSLCTKPRNPSTWSKSASSGSVCLQVTDDSRYVFSYTTSQQSSRRGNCDDSSQVQISVRSLAHDKARRSAVALIVLQVMEPPPTWRVEASSAVGPASPTLTSSSTSCPHRSLITDGLPPR